MGRPRSRLARTIEKRTRRTLFLSLLGIVALSVLLVKVGIPFLVNFSLFIGGLNQSHEEQKKEQSFISPPVLAPLPTATNSARIDISGTASSGEIVKLYLNQELLHEVKVKDKTFMFDNVRLRAGENIVQAKVVTKNNQESNLSEQRAITLKNAPPTLTVESPKGEQSFAKDESPIVVSGKTEPGVRVTVNDFWAIVDESANFSYSLALTKGENKIKVIAIDEAGNRNGVERKVTYAP